MEPSPIYEQPWFGIMVGVTAAIAGLVIWLVSKRCHASRGFEVKLRNKE